MKAEIFNALVWLNRPTVRTVIVGIVLLLVTFKVTALELVVLDDPKCYYCEKFRQGAGQSYEQSGHAEWAPIVYVTWSIGYHRQPNHWPDWLKEAIDNGRVRDVSGTPTFLFIEPINGKPTEIGRMVGYGTEAEFYRAMDHYKGAYEEWKENQ